MPLRLYMVCDTEQIFELSFRSQDNTVTYSFEVFSKEGRTEFIIPCEVLFYNLKIDRATHRKFSLYYTKFEGLDYGGFVNRKFIPISNSSITFSSSKLLPEPQERIGPLGTELSSNFSISDKYYVPTWKDFTSSSNKREITREMINFSRFFHEAQIMRQEAQHTNIQAFKVETMDTETNIRRTRRVSALEEVGKEKRETFSNKSLLEKFASTYSKRSMGLMSTELNYVTNGEVNPFSNAPLTGGCNCSRNKKND